MRVICDIMQWESVDAKDSRVVSSTGWRKKQNYGSFESRAGVYILANANHQVKYVGKAGPGRVVDAISDAKKRNKDFGATLIKVLYTNSNQKALSLSKKLIKKYDPPNNLN